MARVSFEAQRGPIVTQRTNGSTTQQTSIVKLSWSAQMVSIQTLRPAQRNARTHSKEQIRQIDINRDVLERYTRALVSALNAAAIARGSNAQYALSKNSRPARTQPMKSTFDVVAIVAVQRWRPTISKMLADHQSRPVLLDLPTTRSKSSPRSTASDHDGAVP
jgi:hypothetical protein